jgi:predicted CXXCH cytochrome family protein
MKRSMSRRAGPLFGALLLVAGMAVALSPVIPTAVAIDPTPSPASVSPDAASVSPDPGLAGSPDVSPVATPAPTPDATPTPDPSPVATPVADPTTAPSIEPSAAPSADPSSAPSVDPSTAPSADPSPSADPGASPTPAPDPSPSAPPAAEPGVKVTHWWVDMEDDAGALASQGGLDDARIGLQRFTVYDVRFQVVNDGATEATIHPTLQFGTGTQPATWAAVPVVDPTYGVPFYAASDEGTTWEVRTAPIPVARLRGSGTADATVPVDGVSSAGRNPLAALTLPAGSYTEIDFAVRATADATWETVYGFRLELGAANVTAQSDAVVSMGAAPPVDLSPGQSTGVPVEAPIRVLNSPTSGIFARLASATVDRSAPMILAAAPGPPYTTPHGNYTLATDACAACHSSHTGVGSMLLGKAQSPIATLCFTCHDGSGALSNVQAQLASPPLPANVPATATYYSHPTLASTTHVLDSQNEFGGINNRHAECVDCHQPHRADSSLATQTVAGWTVGGAIVGASGVAVTNGVANSEPAFAFQATNQYEYQLCFKCHSGFTQQYPAYGNTAQDASAPSRWTLDKAVELNPANLSFHPIEAQGANQTSTMAGSLSGSAPGKLWAFQTTSTVRCANCHGPSSSVNPAANAQIDLHASANRGILLRNYRDRTLKTRTAAYTATDFSLCYLCHAEAPFVDQSGNSRADSNFREHGFHVSGIAGSGNTATSIDQDGAGGGNAICAECHFRIHGSSYPGNAGATLNPGLVNFAPNVQPYPLAGGQIRFVQRVGSTPGTCTLTCHGYQHNNQQY